MSAEEEGNTSVPEGKGGKIKTLLNQFILSLTSVVVLIIAEWVKSEEKKEAKEKEK